MYYAKKVLLPLSLSSDSSPRNIVFLQNIDKFLCYDNFCCYCKYFTFVALCHYKTKPRVHICTTSNASFFHNFLESWNLPNTRKSHYFQHFFRNDNKHELEFVKLFWKICLWWWVRLIETKGKDNKGFLSIVIYSCILVITIDAIEMFRSWLRKFTKKTIIKRLVVTIRPSLVLKYYKHYNYLQKIQTLIIYKSCRKCLAMKAWVDSDCLWN